MSSGSKTLIMTHENTDFDALASLLAATKLYPEAVPLLPHRLNRNLRDFLTLYGEELPFVRPEDLPCLRISRLILVDAQTFALPKGVRSDEGMQIIIIDHHPLARQLEENMTYHGRETGATTTILIEMMWEVQISISPLEATLLLIGIYEDTGNLSYPTTSSRDLRCAAWLLEQGARLEVAQDFLRYQLTEKQHALYKQLIENLQTYELSGQSIIIASARAENYVEEISTLAHKLRDLYDPDALFLLVDLGDHIQMVARSTSQAIDVGEIAACFEGGGHSRAAAALIRGSSLMEEQARLIELLRLMVHPTVTVGQIMSYGVHTLSPKVKVAQAEKVMRRYGHEGFPVLEEGRIVGILTRREIDRALHHKLGNVPIEAYLHKGEICVSPEDSIEHLQNIMVTHGVGQVPVVKNGEVIGIVTRTDLIKLWGTPPNRSRKDEITKLIEKALPAPLLELVREAGRVAKEMGYNLYLVGGFVRDLLLGIPNLDIDLVVEGDAIALARRLAKEKGGRARSHARFGTAKWIIRDEGEGNFGPYPPALDFVTARTEFYKHPTALPEVERSSIKLDLHRRDFTINTLAIRLDPEHYGELLDFYGGQRDLEEGLIRVLHNLSFVEDPTRILRAVRLEQRLGFRIEERTEELIGSALELLDRVSGDRIRHELYFIFREEEPEKSLRRLAELGVLRQIHPALGWDDWLEGRFRRLQESLPSSEWPDFGDRAVLYFALLACRLRGEEREALIVRLKVPRSEAEVLRQAGALWVACPHLAPDELPPSAIYRLLHGFSDQALFLSWLACDDERARERILLYLQKLRHIRPEIDGAYLKELGLPPGPIYARILSALRDARLDGQVSTLEEERALVEKLLPESLK